MCVCVCIRVRTVRLAALPETHLGHNIPLYETARFFFADGKFKERMLYAQSPMQDPFRYRVMNQCGWWEL